MSTYLNQYLESLGIELWPGEAFYLTDPKSRAQAELWLRDFIRGYEQYVDKCSNWADLPG